VVSGWGLDGGDRSRLLFKDDSPISAAINNVLQFHVAFYYKFDAISRLEMNSQKRNQSQKDIFLVPENMRIF